MKFIGLLNIVFGVCFTIQITYAQNPIPSGLSLDSLEIPGVAFLTNDTVFQSFHLYKPSTYDPLTSPMLFAIHGNGGSGAGTINNIIDIAERRQALVVGVNMILGLGFPTVLHSNLPTYYDQDSISGCRYLRPATEIFKKIYRHLLLRESRPSIPCYLTGYSAGGQFVSRYMLFRQAYPDSIPLQMAVSSSAYFYTFPTETFNGVDMPYACGLMIMPDPNNCIGSQEMLEMLNCDGYINNYYKENYGMLIGTSDTLYLNDSPCGMAQGSNRLQRARTFHAFADSNALNRGTTLNWQYQEIMNAGHSEFVMYNSKDSPADTSTIMEAMLFDTPVQPLSYTLPIADFIEDQTVVGANGVVNFTNLSQNANSYLWNFGDGNYSTQNNPSHTYTVAGVYSVILTAYDTSFCGQYKVKEHVITVTNSSPLFAEKYIKHISNTISNSQTVIAMTEILTNGQLSTMAGYHNDGISLFTIGLNGDTISSKRITLNSNYFIIGQLLNTWDGGYLICGGNNNNLTLLKLDSLQEFHWAKKYNYQGIVNSVVIIDSTILFAFSNSNSLFFVWTDKYGEVTSEFSYHTSGLHQDIFDLIVDSTSIYVSGHYMNPNLELKAMVTRLNLNGTVAWSKAYYFPNHHFANNITNINSGLIALAINKNQAPYDCIVMLIDSSGIIIQSKQFSSFKVEDILVTSDNQILLSGSHNFNQYMSIPKAIKCDLLLDTLWTQSYDTRPAPWYPGWHQINEASNTWDNGFLFAGDNIIKTDSIGLTSCNHIITPMNINNVNLTDTLLIWMNNQANVIADTVTFTFSPTIQHVATSCLTTGMNEVYESKRNMLVFPNPANSVINIQPDFSGQNMRLQIQDYTGRLVQNMICNMDLGGTISVNIEHLNSGLYFLTLENKKSKAFAKILKY